MREKAIKNPFPKFSIDFEREMNKRNFNVDHTHNAENQKPRQAEKQQI